jgi:hypothetical protein
MSTYRTASGKYLDINGLKIKQERTIAVGNSNKNARGDLLGPGGEVIKSRDQISNEFYQSMRKEPLRDSPMMTDEQALRAAEADVFVKQVTNGFDQIEQSLSEEPEVIEPETPASASGGYADALARSQELAEKLKRQRSRI